MAADLEEEGGEVAAAAAGVEVAATTVDRQRRFVQHTVLMMERISICRDRCSRRLDFSELFLRYK